MKSPAYRQTFVAPAQRQKIVMMPYLLSSKSAVNHTGQKSAAALLSVVWIHLAAPYSVIAQKLFSISWTTLKAFLLPVSTICSFTHKLPVCFVLLSMTLLWHRWWGCAHHHSHLPANYLPWTYSNLSKMSFVRSILPSAFFYPQTAWNTPTVKWL